MGTDRAPRSESRISDDSLVYVNLGIGLLTVLANGAALAITLTGKAEQLVGKELEIVLWLALGIVLVGASVFGVVQRRAKVTILKFQSLAIATLATMLALWGVTLLFGKLPESRTIWTFGYLTLVALYGVYLIARFFQGPRFNALRFYAKMLFLPLCILVDAANFLRVGGFFAS